MATKYLRELQMIGYFVTEDLGEGIEGEVFKAFAHQAIAFDVPVREGESIEGCRYSEERGFYLRKVYYGGEACAIKRSSGDIDREIAIMRQLNHPNCVQYFDTIEVFRKNYIVMEFINGRQDFRTFISRFKVSRLARRAPKLDDWTARLIIKHMVIGLEYLHSEGIAHRDLNDCNFMAHCEGQQMVWKIVDFGLSNKSGDFAGDISRLFQHIQTVLATKGMQNEVRQGIQEVVDRHHQQVIRTSQEMLQELRPFFPPVNEVTHREDDPPEDSEAFAFCNDLDD